MPNIKEIRDGGSDPNTPSIKEMRESQRKGSVGIGTNTEDYADRMAARNHGTGLGEGNDEKFPVAADYKESSGKGSGLPWE